jgi:hypothetical protein
MGTNTLAAKVTGNAVAAADPNQFRTAFIGDLVPRDATGGPVASSGSVGSASYPFSSAFFDISSYITIGSPTVDGSVRLSVSNSSLICEYRESGTWKMSGAFIPQTGE